MSEVVADATVADPAATTRGTGTTTIVAAGVVADRHLAAIAETAVSVIAIVEATVTIATSTMTLAGADTEVVAVMETVRTKGVGARRTHASAMAVTSGAGGTTRGETEVGHGRRRDGVAGRSDTAGAGGATQHVSSVFYLMCGPGVDSGAPCDKRREEISGGQSQREE